MLKRLTLLRKETKHYSIKDLERSIRNLTKILNEKKQEKAKLLEKLEEKEEIRLSAIQKLEENNIPVPQELKKPLELADVMPKRRRRRREKTPVEESTE